MRWNFAVLPINLLILELCAGKIIHSFVSFKRRFIVTQNKLSFMPLIGQKQALRYPLGLRETLGFVRDAMILTTGMNK